MTARVGREGAARPRGGPGAQALASYRRAREVALKTCVSCAPGTDETLVPGREGERSVRAPTITLSEKANPPWSRTASSADSTSSKGRAVRGETGGWPRTARGREGRLVSMEGPGVWISVRVRALSAMAQPGAVRARGARLRSSSRGGAELSRVGPLERPRGGCVGPLCVVSAAGRSAG